LSSILGRETLSANETLSEQKFADGSDVRSCEAPDHCLARVVAHIIRSYIPGLTHWDFRTFQHPAMSSEGAAARSLTISLEVRRVRMKKSRPIHFGGSKQWNARILPSAASSGGALLLAILAITHL
jgi:hypothetical protein